MTTLAGSRDHAGVGVQFLRGPATAVAQWLGTGVVPATVGRVGGWTVVLPRGASHAAPPYDDALSILAARPMPPKLGPALGFWAIDNRAVISVSGARRRDLRWVFWEPESGVVHPPGLETAPVAAVLRAAGGGSGPDFTELLRERHIPVPRLLAALVSVLELPKPRLLVDPEERQSLENAREVEPSPEQVARFDDAVRHAVLLRKELEIER